MEEINNEDSILEESGEVLVEDELQKMLSNYGIDVDNIGVPEEVLKFLNIEDDKKDQ